eukprot:423447-Amphidinium_carterae.1
MAGISYSREHSVQSHDASCDRSLCQIRPWSKSRCGHRQQESSGPEHTSPNHRLMPGWCHLQS